ncbi:MAG: hypothetical protein ACJAVK_000504 [Akkermansiaceae bacterium]|jgi:hypothetical protein
MKKILLTVLSLCALCPSAMAQDEPPKYLRFLPLGDLPTWEEELIDGIRQGKEPPPGTMPPNPVCMVSGGEVVPFKLSLRTMTGIKKMMGGTPGLLLKDGETPESPNLLRKPLPAAPLSLGVIFADPATMQWAKPKMLVLKDDPDAFPVGKIRFVNVSDKVVIVQLGGPSKRPFGIAPGATSLRPITQGVNLIKVGYQTAAGGQKQIWNNQIRVLANQRVQCFFYKALPEEGKDAVKFHYTPEPMPRVPQAG